MGYPSFRLDGQVALVTGAAQGIGRAIALGLADAGATVAAADLRADTLPEVEQALRALGRPGLALALDVRDPAAVQRAVDRVVAAHGRLDVLVNNAGVRVHKPALEHSLEDWELVFAVNSTGPFLCSQAAARVMRERGSGAIITIASQLATVVTSQRVAYCASKAAVVQMARVLALEWAAYGIRVNCVSPGPTRTPFTEAAMAAGAMPVVAASVPLGRMAEPDEMVGAVVYLASDAARYVTGACIVVDGGHSLSWR
ncbi:MAG: SDR family oxidoreductase [Chloroflexi bacterium]|nr:SDR family oxidoreductase [Chloroflexota bacterium]